MPEPGVAGSYELVERRGDGSLLLRPERERLSDVVRETEGQVFRAEEFAAHLERVAASADDEVIAGEAHVIWRRIGHREVLREP